LTLVTAGRVGKAHGRDGSFYVERAQADVLAEGGMVVLASCRRRIERRAGDDTRPLVRLSDLDDPRPLRGEALLVEQELGENEWLAADLVGCAIRGLGRVRRVLEGPSCSALELEDGELVPFVSDAIVSVDVAGREIMVDRGFLG
jgi:16S rRNA processing protein RimM